MIKRSISTKLTIGFVLIVIISTLCIGVIAINIFKNNIFQIKEKNMTQRAKELGPVLAPYIENDLESKEYKNILKVVSSVDNIKVWVGNLKGNLKAIDESKDIVIERSPELQKNYSEVIKDTFQGNGKTMQEYNAYYDENMITEVYPIKTNDNRVVGGVHKNNLTHISY